MQKLPEAKTRVVKKYTKKYIYLGRKSLARCFNSVSEKEKSRYFILDDAYVCVFYINRIFLKKMSLKMRNNKISIYVHESFTKQHKYLYETGSGSIKIKFTAVSFRYTQLVIFFSFFVSLLVHPQSNVVDGVFWKYFHVYQIEFLCILLYFFLFTSLLVVLLNIFGIFLATC